MIRFDQRTRRFNYRVVGVALGGDTVLLHRAVHEPFWTLPGGRAEHGETAEDTIKREMLEELETVVDVVRLLLPLLPAFLPSGLANLPTSVVHLVQRDTVPSNTTPG